MKQSQLQFKPDETPKAGVQRLVAAQRSQAEAFLADTKHPAKAIHQVRLRLKFLRALLRLSRELTGEQFYKRENTRLKKAAAALSAWRDVTVVCSILQGLSKELEPSHRPALQAVIKRLSAVPDTRGRQHALQQAVKAIRSTEESLQYCKFKQPALTAFSPALQKSYRQAHRSLKTAFSAGTDEAFHESRKRVKRLFYHIGLFEPAWPEHLKKVRRHLRNIQVTLGKDHDLSVARDILATGIGEKKLRQGMETILQQRNHKLRKLAAKESAGVFTAPPRTFAGKLARHINSWAQPAKPLSPRVPAIV